MYHQPMQPIEPSCFAPFQAFNNPYPISGSQTTQISFQSNNEHYFTLESSPSTGYALYNTPSIVSLSSDTSPSPQGSHSYHSNPQQHYSDNAYGSPFSGSSFVDGSSEMKQKLEDLESILMSPEYDVDDSCISSFSDANQMMEMDLKQMLLSCAAAVSDDDHLTAKRLMDAMQTKVSISGEPIQRLGAYMLEGLRARSLFSGSHIYKKLNCNEPTSKELMSYMYVLAQICPYYKFAYTASNAAILEAMAYETRIHIIDFQIAQGGQWMSLVESLAGRPGGPPRVRITGVDDSQSAHARGGGLHIVGNKLAEFAAQRGVPFEFHIAAMCGSEVELENLGVRYGEEALAVNFPYVLHHMPDESVTVRNHRDRLLRLVKSLSPKIVTLVEQESNTNTAPFFPRFRETLDYYLAMFESIDAARARDDKQRIRAEENCVGRDIVNLIACEGAERVERHEPFGKWRSRLSMAGFTQCPLSYSVGAVVKDALKDFSKNYRLGERDGAIFLGWKERTMSSFSVWR